MMWLRPAPGIYKHKLQDVQNIWEIIEERKSTSGKKKVLYKTNYQYSVPSQFSDKKSY